MSAIVPRVRCAVKERLLLHLRLCRDAGLKTRYLFIINMLNGRGAYETGVRIHPTTMSRALAMIHARRGNPRPAVKCPWSETAKNRRLNTIRRVLASLPRGHVGVYEDEVDIHLNPKIGLDWMVRSQQKEVMTPGKNQKRYLAGALDIDTGLLVWVEGDRKTSPLFLDLLDKLVATYANAKVIHVVLDNYRIHSSEIVHAALSGYLRGRFELHFLPPYCPKYNRIERVWQDLHANVTRNHTCPTMTKLMREVRAYLRKRNGGVIRSKQRKAA